MRAYLLYLAVAYGWTWLLWIPALVYSARTGLTLPTIDAGIGAWTSLGGLDLAFAIAFQLAVYGPLIGAIVALAVRARDRAPHWRADLVRFRVPARWWGFVLVWPLALAALVVAAGTVAGGGAPRWNALPSVGVIGVMLGVQLLTSGLEEPGWRGFGWPVLRATHGFENAGWFLGLAWAGWHLPYVIYLNRAAPLWSLPLTIAGFTMSIVAMGYVHAWVFQATRSLPLNIALHAWANVTNTIVFLVQPNPVVPLATAGFAWLFAAWILRGEKRAASR